MLRRATSMLTIFGVGVACAVAVTTASVGSAGAATPPGPAPVQQPPSGMVTADALPTAQIDGVAWKQVIVGNTVYVGGQFSHARPAGTSPGDPAEVPRYGLMSYTLNDLNGAMTSFAPVLDGQVTNMAVSPDQSTLYVVGDFTHVNGVVHNRVAAFTLTDGGATATLNPSFTGGTNGAAYAVTATNTTVYVGGLFAQANGVTRSRLAAFDTNGTLTGWAPVADYKVADMVLSPSGAKVVLAGSFTTINGNNVYGFAAVDATTGASVPWAANATVQAYGTGSGFTSVTSDGTAIFATAYNYHGTGNLEGTVETDPETGAVRWVEDCHGDTYGAVSVNNIVYTVGHPHDCRNLNGWPDFSPRQWRRTIAFTHDATGTLPHDYTGYPDHYGLPAPSLINWYPDLNTGTVTGQGQAAWAVTGNSQYVVEGGEFPSVNGTPQQGLVRFATRAIVTRPKSGPRQTPGEGFTPVLTTPAAGTVRVAFHGLYDRDGQTLNYVIQRANVTIASGSFTTHWWSRPMIGFVDTGAPTNTPTTYTVTLTDADGNAFTSNPATITADGHDGGPTAFDQQMLADGASSYWPLSEASGTTAYDQAAYNDLDAVGGVTRGAAGPVAGENATTFNGSTGYLAGRTAQPAPATVSVSAWVKTTTTRGGRIVGLGDNPTGLSATADRMLYLDNSGKVYFGMLNSTYVKTTVASTSTINNGQWHQVVGSYGNNTMSLWVDGVLVAQRTDVPLPPVGYNGWWRIGGDTLSGWPSAPSSNYLNGSIGSVAVFPTVISRVQVQNEYKASGRAFTLPSGPSDAYGAAVFADDPGFYYRLDETSGTTAADAGAYSNNGKYSGGVTLGQPSTVTTSGTAVKFNGTNATVGSGRAQANPLQYSTEAWFNTTSTSGGKIFSFGNAQTGGSAAATEDRQVYLLANGQLAFGALSGSTRIVLTSPGSNYNDGAWHQVVATEGVTGMKLYVDGALVASNANQAAGKYTGYWRIGGDANTWASGTSGYFTGLIDEAAQYNYVLSASRVAAHYAASPAGRPQGPAASFTYTVPSASTVALDATGSTDDSGTITSYAWNFGDGTSGTGATVSHTYATPGTYTVGLTITDDGAKTDSTSQTIQVGPTGSVSATAYGTPVGGNYSQLTVTTDVHGFTPGTSCQASVGGNDASQSDESATLSGQTDVNGTLSLSGRVSDSQGRGFVWTAGNTYYYSVACTGYSGALTGTLVLSPAGASSGVPGAYTALTPYRLLDTRSGLGGTRPGPKGSVTIQVTGRGGVPGTGVSAVALTVTATQPTALGYLTAYGAGTVQPTASNVNFAKGQTVANVAVVPVGTDGKVTIFNGSGGSTQVLADVSGYFQSGSPAAAGAFAPLPPTRLLDTRSGKGGSRPAPRGTLALQVTGTGGVPSSGVSAVLINLTATNSTGTGFITAWADRAIQPTASNLNYVRGATVANLAVVPVGTDGKIALYNGSAGTVDLLGDIAGYYLAGTPSESGTFSSVAPSRVLDTRTGTPVAAGATIGVQVGGKAGVPSSGVSAAVLNVTVTTPAQHGYLTVYGSGTRPTASNLNFAASQTVAGLVVAPMTSDGRVFIYNGSGGTTNLLADVLGYVKA